MLTCSYVVYPGYAVAHILDTPTFLLAPPLSLSSVSALILDTFVS